MQMAKSKIFILVLVLCCIGGVWFWKSKVSAPTRTSTRSVLLNEKLKNADFSLHLTGPMDFARYAEYGLPMIVDYGATACVPCKEMAPVLEKLNAEMKGKAFIKFADVWKYRDATRNVPLQIIPTQFFVDAQGKPFVPSEALAKEIPFTTYQNRNTLEVWFTMHQGALTEEQMRKILKEMGVQ